MSAIKNFFEQNKKYSADILRIALSAVFLWFGIDQLVNPGYFLGYVPAWIHSNPALPILSAHSMIIINGIFEVIFGIFLLIGLFTRIAAFLLALNLFGIAFSLGYNDIAVRDFGLAFAAVSLVFSGGGELSFDNRRKNQNK